MPFAPLLLAAAVVSLILEEPAPPQIAVGPSLRSELLAEIDRPVTGSGDRRIFAVGEIHGAVENARFVQALTEALQARGFKVRIFLEQPDDGMILRTADEGAFLQSMKESAFWSGSWQDGRAGAAKACTLFALQKGGADLVPVDTPPPPGSQLDREAIMAANLVKNLKDVRTGGGKKVAAIFWAGNFHVYTAPGGQPTAFDQARQALPEWTATTLYVSALAGSAFNCRRPPAGCAVHPTLPKGNVPLGLSAQPSGELYYFWEAYHPDRPAAEQLPAAKSLKALCP